MSAPRATTTPGHRVRLARRNHDALETARRKAAEELTAAIAEWQRVTVAEPDKYWSERGGEMVLRDLPAECNRYDADGERCGDDAIAWSASGEARCAEHADDLEKNC